MVSLVSQAEAARQLRLVEAAMTADQIADMNFKAEQASAIIANYLKRPFIEGPLVPSPTKQVQRRVDLEEAKIERRETPEVLWTDEVPPPFYPFWPWFPWWAPPPPSIPPEPPPAWTPVDTPIMVKAAILIVLTALYDGRTPEDAMLSPAVTSILERMRDPTAA